MQCSSCRGVYHEATGHRFTANVQICGPCARHFVTWLKGHLRRRWGGVEFYIAAATSIRAPVVQADRTQVSEA
jgi:hypothetical protein